LNDFAAITAMDRNRISLTLDFSNVMSALTPSRQDDARS
jgi:hypothetical protein